MHHGHDAQDEYLEPATEGHKARLMVIMLVAVEAAFYFTEYGSGMAHYLAWVAQGNEFNLAGFIFFGFTTSFSIALICAVVADIFLSAAFRR